MPNEEAHSLPLEGERRIVEDADARGIAVTLEGGEVWYIPPMPLSPRGQKIADLLDTMVTCEVRLQAAQKRVEIAERSLVDADDLAAVDAAEKRLTDAVRARDGVQDDLQRHCAEIALHGLRCFYSVTRAEAERLVSQRYFEEVLRALNGQDTRTSDIELAAALLKRLGMEKGGDGDADGPFAASTSGDTGAAFS